MRKASIALCAALVGLLGACGGGGDPTPEERALELLDAQRITFAMRPHVTRAQVTEWDQRWPEILRLQSKPTHCEGEPEAQARCVLEWQSLTHPWVWEPGV